MRLLLLSTTTGYQLRAFNTAAERLGIELVFGTDRCHTLEDPWQDSAIAVRFHEEDASLRRIIETSRECPLHGVIAVGDRPVVLAARAADALGLAGHPPRAAAASANKLLTRQCLAAGGLNVPWFFIVDARAPDRSVLADPRLCFPCVVKPVGLSGSRGVIRADSASELEEALSRVRALLARTDVRALRTGLEDELLVEGFIEGREYAVEGVLTHGSLQVFAVFDKPDPLDGPFFEETIYVTPSALPPHLQQQIHAETERAARVLGLRHGPVHAECRLGAGGIFMIEVAARPIGGLCSRALRFEGEASLEEVLLRHAIADDISRCQRERCASAVMMIPISRRGLLKGVRGEEEARRVSGVYDVRITAKADQLVEPLPEAASYLGFIFARGTSPADAELAVREAHRCLSFVIEKEIAVR